MASQGNYCAPAVWLTPVNVLRTMTPMRDLSPVLIEIVHNWAWLLRTGAMEFEETLEPNSVVMVWFSDEAVLTPPSSADDWDGVIQEIAFLPAEVVNPLWLEGGRRSLLLRKFAESLAEGCWIDERQRPVDMIVHLVDIPPATAGMTGGFQVWMHCAQGTVMSVTTLGLDVDAQIALAPDGAVKVEGAMAIDGYLERYL